MVYTPKEKDFLSCLNSLKSTQERAKQSIIDREVRIKKAEVELRQTIARRLLISRTVKTFALCHGERMIFKKEKITRRELEDVLKER